MICIYAIINIADDKHYIGQTSDEVLRWREHRKQLKGFYHHSLFLQRAWCKHGEKSFIFVVLEVVDDIAKLNEREQYWMDILSPEYNMLKIAGSTRGYKHTDEARANMSKAHKGEIRSEEFKRKMSERLKGNTYNNGRKQSPERIEARAKFHRGKIVSEETRMKKSIAMTGFKHTEESKARMSEAAKNKPPVSDETRKKLSEATKKQWQRYLTEI